jgi:hypothetical protein
MENIQHSTTNIEIQCAMVGRVAPRAPSELQDKSARAERRALPQTLGVRCWLLDVSCAREKRQFFPNHCHFATIPG